MTVRKIIIAIDGYSACGKSTTAREVARILGYRYVDSGAMYRSVTLSFIRRHVSLTNPIEIDHALQDVHINFWVNSHGLTETFLNGVNVESEIRQREVSEQVSQVSTVKAVREALVKHQRRMGKEKNIVMDGRDIGTVVFPEADLKLFMTADMEVRAARRQLEWLENDELIGLKEVIANIKQRDEMDMTRKVSPLRQADDAVVIDTTHFAIDEQVDEVVRMAIQKMVSSE